MSVQRAAVRPDAYVDSVKLLNVSRDLQQREGLTYAAAVMGTEANLELLREAGFAGGELDGVSANDLVIAVTADTEDAADDALAAAEQALGSGGTAGEDGGASAPPRPRELDDALAELPEATLAVVSVPGPYAALEAHKALSAGLHVLLFSDNVDVASELALKRRAVDRGLLLMGPGAGTAALAGVGLGFANAVRQGPVRVVAAAGTGAQEVMTLLHRWGSGVSEVVGVGGRDLSADVGGLMTRAVLGADDGQVLLVVSKPPAPEVAQAVLADLHGRRAVCAFLGLEPDDIGAAPEVRVASTLEEAVRQTLELLELDAPDVGAGLPLQASAAIDEQRGDIARTAVRGVFSGGTLCYEAMVVLSRRLGPVHSNTPLREGWALPAPQGAHVCLDLGEEEFTRGRPHPMIDPLARVDELRGAGADPTTAVVLLDVVLGHGAADDPAGALAPVLEEVREAGPAVVAYVLGTELDPQDADAQRKRLRAAGCLVAPTAARAALLAGAIAARQPSLAGEPP